MLPSSEIPSFIRQKIICECCGRIGHKADSCIIHGPKFLPPSIGRNINQFNALHGEEPTETPREWSSQPTADRLKSRTSSPKTSPMVSFIMERLNHHAIDNGDVKVHTSDSPFESSYESVPDPDTTPIRSIEDDEMYHLLEFFHSEHDEDILYVDI